MKNISTFFIESFRNFNDFKMIFPEKKQKKDEKLNLNILIGRNGSGKSNLLDALYSIGTKDSPAEVGFKFYMLDDENNLLLANLDNVTKETINKMPELKYWKHVVRCHCSISSRNKENFHGDGQKIRVNLEETAPEEFPNSGLEYTYFSDKALDFDMERSKIAYIANILSGQYLKEINNKESLWHKLNKIVIEENPNESEKELQVKAIWIKAHDGNVDFNYNSNLPPCSFIKYRGEINADEFAYYWTIEDINKYYQDHNYQNPYTLLKENFNEYCYDMGFLYSLEANGDICPSNTLSDGQRALLYRFAVVNLLKAEDRKCLLLLDEPETYFNEYWKSYFIYLLWETLKNKPHDVFISTHSAMLITDTKPEEVHRLVDTNSGAYHYKPQVNTYGVSVVDIGKYLFMMESDIGNRAKKEIKEILIKEIPTKKEDIEKFNNEISAILRQVGPGEWRWKLRTKQKEIEKQLLKYRD